MIDNDDEPIKVGFRDPQEGWERAGRSTVHRLTPRVWWVDIRGYQSTVVVGEESVLVIDPLSDGRGGELLSIIADQIGLPVSAVCYSHHHHDHVADAYVFSKAATSRSLEVLGTSACASRVRARGTGLAVTTLLDESADFEFEGVRIQAKVVGGHTPDSTALFLPDEGVAHTADLLHPLQMEFPFFGMATDVESYMEALEELLATEWSFLTAGHGNIGSRADVQVVLTYIQGLQHAVRAALKARDVSDYAAGGARGYAVLNAWRTDVVEDAAAELRPDWGHMTGYEDAVRTHGDRVFFDEVWFLKSNDSNGRA